MKFKIQYSTGGSLEPTPTEIQFDNDSLREAVREWLNNESDAIQKYGHISNWDVSQVTNMRKLFRNAEYFNEDITQWDVSGVTAMSHMFSGANAFNQNIGGWDVSQVTTMHDMFLKAWNFNQDISEWNVSQVKDMEGMFNGAINFNQDINTKEVTRSDGTTYVAWDVSQVKNMHNMFKDATAFNKDIGEWNVSNVRDMTGMFYKAEDFNQDIRKWNVSQVRDMDVMFYGARAFNQDIGQWPMGQYINTGYMFDHSGMSAKTFKGIYGARIADHFDLEDSKQDVVMEPYTRWERKKNAVTLMSGLNRKDREGTLSTPQELRRMVFNPDDIGRKVASYLGGSKN